MPPKPSSNATTSKISRPVPPPTPPTLETTDASINSYPDPHTSDGPTLQPQDDIPSDPPGPSTTFMTRIPSPPLPDFSRRGGIAEDDSDESDDEILAELPIYLSPSLHPDLHLFQYPLHHRSLTTPTWASDRGKSISARVKESVGRVEVEIPVDAGIHVWRDERARELGFVTDVHAVNGAGGDEVEGGVSGRVGVEKKERKKKKEGKWGDKMRLRSEIVPGNTGYYSGIVHDGALHLHPIAKLQQLRTSLQYVDDFDTRERQTSRRHRAEDGDDEGDGKKLAKSAAAGGSTTVHGRIAKDDENDGSGSIRDFRMRMWTNRQREEEDKWIPYAWKEGQDESVLEKLAELLVPEEKRGRLECRTRGLDYLDKA